MKNKLILTLLFSSSIFANSNTVQQEQALAIPAASDLQTGNNPAVQTPGGTIIYLGPETKTDEERILKAIFQLVRAHAYLTSYNYWGRSKNPVSKSIKKAELLIEKSKVYLEFYNKKIDWTYIQNLGTKEGDARRASMENYNMESPEEDPEIKKVMNVIEKFEQSILPLIEKATGSDYEF